MRKTFVGLAAVAATVLGAASTAAAKPVYDIKATWGDTNLAPGGVGQFQIVARNLSEQTAIAKSSEKLTIADTLPAGVTVTAIRWGSGTLVLSTLTKACSGVGTKTATCVMPPSLLPEWAHGRGTQKGFIAMEPTGYLPLIEVEVETPLGASGTAANTAILYGGEGMLPDGSPCAKNTAELTTPPTLPPCAQDVDQVPFSATPSSFGIVGGSFQADFFDGEYPLGKPTRTAGDHPFEFRFNFDVTGRTTTGVEWPRLVSDAPPKTVQATLPRGVIGNPEALPKCDPVKFAQEGSTPDSTACPANTQVGYIDIWAPNSGSSATGTTATSKDLSRVPLYNLVPPRGKLADLGFSGATFVQAHIYPVLDPTHNYSIESLTPNISSGVILRGVEVTIWGVPGDPAHDLYRYYPEAQHTGETYEGGSEIMKAGGAPFAGAIRPFLTNPMDCKEENGAPRDNGGASVSVDSYLKPGEFTPVQEYANHDNVEGCEDPRFRFEPEIKLEPTDHHAGAPTGLEVKLEVPQRNDEVKNAQELYAKNGFVQGISTPPIKKTIVKLPVGMTVSPSAGQGLGGCTSAQVGLGTDNPVTCPEDSQIGTLILHSPNLPENEPLEGRVYIAAQNDNPFKTLFALYLVFERAERGLLVKVPGKLELDESTGQITTTVDDIPQFPVKEVQLQFKGGARAALVNPSTCGAKTITAEYFTWQDPNTPHVATNSYPITQRPDGSAWVNNLSERPFAPQLSAGTANPLGGVFSPFTLRLTRTDDEQEISTLGLTMAPGLLAKLAGVAQCPEASIAQAQNPNRSGAEELANPSCPVASQIGTLLVGTGVGTSLTYVGGKVYFAGPYKGAPFSLLVISPAVVGPYDLGVVVVRNALYIDPLTAQAKVLSDPFPQILKGIPVRIRDVRVSIDRPEFIFNPTDCTEQQISSAIGSIDGASASPASRFQIANCATLAFKPKFTASTSGKPSRKNGASLDVKLSYPKAPWGTQANIAKVKVNLPKQLPSRLTTLQKACPDATFNANPASCPAGSKVGTATTTTPILPEALNGPAYFVSHGGAKFPELVVVLQGDGVTVQLHGETFISQSRDHELHVPSGARCAGRDVRAEAAPGAELGAGGQREPVQVEAHDAHDVHRAERAAAQTINEDHGHGLPQVEEGQSEG